MSSSVPVSEFRFKFIKGAQACSVARELGEFAFESGAWVDAVANARHRPHELVVVQAFRQGKVEASLTGGVHHRRGVPIFESMPMGGYGGWRATSEMDAGTKAALTHRLLRRAPWPVVVLTEPPRQTGPVALAPRVGWRRDGGAWYRSSGLETHLLALDEEAVMLQRARPSVRSYLRKVDRLGFSLDRGGAELVPVIAEAYRAGSEGWQVSSSNLLPDAFFQALAQEGRMEIWVARRGDELVGVAAFLLGRQEVQYQASGTRRIQGPVSAMDVLIWSASQHYRQRGFRSMNLGASEGLDSVRRFKQKFGAQAVPYCQTTWVLPWFVGRQSIAAAETDPS
jgi:hypothetical protein